MSLGNYWLLMRLGKLPEEEKVPEEEITDDAKAIQKAVEEKASMTVDKLEGVGTITANALENSGIKYIADLVVRDSVELAELTSLTRVACDKLVQQARDIWRESSISEESFMSARTILEYRANKLERFSTSCPELDKWFKGGIETEAVTEFYGEFGAGKTQMCHTLAVSVQRPVEDGGLGGEVIWIDTENTFRPRRIIQIAMGKGYASTEEDAKRFLDGITIARAYTSAHQEQILKYLSSHLTEEEAKRQPDQPKPRLIVVDSIGALFRNEYTGRGHLADRQQRLGRFMRLLTRVAETYKMAAVITNQVVSSPDGGGPYKVPDKPMGGNAVGHVSMYRVGMNKGGRSKSTLIMLDSPSHPSNWQCVVTRTEAGIEDGEIGTAPKKMGKRDKDSISVDGN